MTDKWQPIQEEYKEALYKLGKTIDRQLNPDWLKTPETCWIIIMSPFGDGGRVNYLSNGRREDMIKTMENLLENMKKGVLDEGQVKVKKEESNGSNDPK